MNICTGRAIARLEEKCEDQGKSMKTGRTLDWAEMSIGKARRASTSDRIAQSNPRNDQYLK